MWGFKKKTIEEKKFLDKFQEKITDTILKIPVEKWNCSPYNDNDHISIQSEEFVLNIHKNITGFYVTFYIFSENSQHMLRLYEDSIVYNFYIEEATYSNQIKVLDKIKKIYQDVKDLKEVRKNDRTLELLKKFEAQNEV